jgi:signal transduction histidine kinase
MNRDMTLPPDRGSRPPELSDFIAAVSHEVRQPVASIRGLTEMLLGHWADFSEKEKIDMLREVHHNGDRVGRLVDELLEASRSGTSQLVLRRQETDVSALVAQVTSDLRISHPDLEVSVELSPELPKVLVDPFKLEQVLANILENACEHGSAADVQVAGALKPMPGGDVVEISVSDKGKGIARRDLSHVSEMSFRGATGDPAGPGPEGPGPEGPGPEGPGPEGLGRRGPGQKGLGLGLWISKGIVEAHGGELVASSVPGEGTTMSFTIPLHDGAGAGKLAGK